MLCNVYRFVDANGTQYYPVKEIAGPYGTTFAFTGPKVNYLPQKCNKYTPTYKCTLVSMIEQ